MSEWVKCSERMPEKDGRYLVCEQWYGSSKWIGVCSLRNGKWDSPNIEYYQPLPEAPKNDLLPR